MTVDVDAVGRRVEALLDRIGEADPAIAGLTDDLVAELVTLYGAGLERLVAQLRAAAPEALPGLASDPVLRGLLALHDLLPDELEARVEAALDACRPYLGSHGGGVSLLAVDHGVVKLRLEGTCDGCGASEITLKNAVEAAIREAAPEVIDIDVEGAVPLGQGHAPPAGGPPGPLVNGRPTLPMVQPTVGG